ncbi:transcriptional regulator, TetR family [Sulfitobacter marinus]|uniref:Transcriptional regulator, TetR family n=1 Tax=Sulfitobacter marinus TaxID=394264 RepID=A0A1I6QZK4_9RHOB|nr:TetR/AcrR family transcriptional regulator [Sulfitobacter marinus]SFS57907.1 transcriptional regulator, TetR family [Sulfitobacter marinus]
MKTKQPFHHGSLKQALLDASGALLDQQGPEGVTIRAIAREVGVSHAAPVNHYKDREALLTALATVLFKDILASVQEKLSDKNLPASTRISAFAIVLFEYAMAYPNRYRLLWHTGLVNHDDPELLDVMDQFYNACRAEIAGAGLCSEQDTETYAIALWSLVHGYTDLRLTGMFEAKNDTISGRPRLEAMLDMFLNPSHAKSP